MYVPKYDFWLSLMCKKTLIDQMNQELCLCRQLINTLPQLQNIILEIVIFFSNQDKYVSKYGITSFNVFTN